MANNNCVFEFSILLILLKLREYQQSITDIHVNKKKLTPFQKISIFVYSKIRVFSDEDFAKTI